MTKISAIIARRVLPPPQPKLPHTENLSPMLSFMSSPEAPTGSEFLSLLRISEFFGFQWQNLAEILRLFKKYNNLRKVAVRECMTDYTLVDWMV